MFNVCHTCGSYAEMPDIDPAGPDVVCRDCGARRRFRRLPLFLVTGASSSGKTVIAEALVGELRECVVLEHDLLWQKQYDTLEDGYRVFRRLWLHLAANLAQSGRPVVLIGTTLPEQNEQLPERAYFSATHYLGLVCDDDLLVQRLRSRPAWRGINEAFVDRMVSFNRWLKENAASCAPPLFLVDTSLGSPEAVASEVAAWVRWQL